jgi:UDP-N-acetylmuramoyl-L-alanyl-D-glutamate--2,6-diaminopimelate ligase
MMAASELNPMSLAELLAGIEVIGEVPAIGIDGMALDSRRLKQGDLFIACAGYQRHGLEYIDDAIANGAEVVLAEVCSNWLPEKIAALSEEKNILIVPVGALTEAVSLIAGRFYGNPSQEFPMIGITGTNGKTSSSLFIAQAFAGSKKVAVMGTIGNGFPGDLVPSTHTTMDPVSVQAALADLHQRQADMVVMEVSSHALHQGRVADVQFDIAVLTNFSRDHLDYHGTMADYAEAKSLLFRMNNLKSAVINADDELGQRLIAEMQTSPASVLAYGTSEIDTGKVDSWIRADHIRMLPDGVQFDVLSSWGQASVSLGLIGRFNVQNAMVALGVMLECGVDFKQAIADLQKLETVPGRMELITKDQGPSVVVDFAHTPDALEQVLKSLKAHVNGKLYCVFGCGGDRDKGKRPQMGQVAESLADVVVLTSDNPRSENPDDIIEDIKQGLESADKAIVEPSRAKAIGMAVEIASKGDVVLVAGKGHEAFQVVGDLKLPFSDQEQVRSALEAL